ncbi:hypothetical protein Ahia01_001128300 [Argonauta hians]
MDGPPNTNCLKSIACNLTLSLSVSHYRPNILFAADSPQTVTRPLRKLPVAKADAPWICIHIMRWMAIGSQKSSSISLFSKRGNKKLDSMRDV